MGHRIFADSRGLQKEICETRGKGVKRGKQLPVDKTPVGDEINWLAVEL